jgi:hypothetical protein
MSSAIIVPYLIWVEQYITLKQKWNMHPPPIYPHLPHFHNHGLAIPFHFIWKEIFEECFSSRLSQNPKSSKRRSKEKRERKKLLKERERKSIEKKRKEKRSFKSPCKNGKSIFWEEKNISTSKSFYVSPFSPPPSYHFQNPFQNHLRKFHSSFWPSFNLAICMTCILCLYPRAPHI